MLLIPTFPLASAFVYGVYICLKLYFGHHSWFGYGVMMMMIYGKWRSNWTELSIVHWSCCCF